MQSAVVVCVLALAEVVFCDLGPTGGVTEDARDWNKRELGLLFMINMML